MIDPKVALEPLEAARPERLERYGSRDELARTLVDVDAGVERTLRLLLRADTGAPDELRVSALSASELPRERLLASLRERDRISLRLAGEVHELGRAAERAGSGEARAADADLGLRVAALLRDELHAASERGVRGAAHHAVEEGPLEPTSAVPPPPSRRASRWRVAAGIGVVGLVVLAAVLLLGGGESDLEAGIAAFDRGERVQAAVLLERWLEDHPDDPTGLLYMARVERRAGRLGEAAELLERAATAAPSDADVRRELGHLFMELERPAPAARQYERAVELAPEVTLGWVGWVRALRAAGDSARALDVLRRAPDEARAVLARDQP
ncbi:MAG TPA: tetratricopeptide repeat protein [Longimicrobiales bacterium]|nr:tetratricopeptide repeat protein [Longimicrobiales bacterium]